MNKALDILRRLASGDNRGDFFISNELLKEVEELLAQPEQTEQEPVAWMWDEMFCEDWTTVSSVIKPSKSKYVDNVRPLYLTPPRREPLSDKEITKNTPKLIHIGERLAFHAGVRFSERHHIIGGGE